MELDPAPINRIGLSALVQTSFGTNSYPTTPMASQTVSMMHWKSRADDKGSKE